MNKKMFFIFLFILSIPFSLATSFSCDTILFSDTFNYNDAFTNHGWSDFDNGICNDAQVTPYPNITNTFGYNLTGFASECVARIDTPTLSPSIINDSLYFIKFEDNIRQVTQSIESYVWAGPSGTSKLQFGLYSNGSILVTSIFSSNIEPCNGGLYDFNMSNEYVILFNMSDFGGNGSYSLYKNSLLLAGCNRKRLNGINTIDNVIFFNDIYAAKPTSQYFDNVFICKGRISNASICSFPTLFCDNFDYSYSIALKGWIPYGYVGILDDTTFPIDNMLYENTNKVMNPTHTTAEFPIEYQLDATTAIINSKYAPVFSSEFDLIIESGGFSYTAGINQYTIAYILKALDDGNGTVSWQYGKSDGSFSSLCPSCTPVNSSGKIKINTYFASRSKYPFNTTNQADYVDIYFSSQYLGRINGLINNLSDYLSYYEINKDSDWLFKIDNYYVMAGIDKDTNTLPYFYTPIYTFENTTTNTNQGSSDAYTNIQSLWEALGLKSAASRYFFGLMLMFVVLIVTVGVCLSVHIAPSPVLIVVEEFFFMVLLAFIRLMPIWLPVFIGILGVIGLGLYVFKAFRGAGGE